MYPPEREKRKEWRKAPYYEDAGKVECRTTCAHCDDFDETGPVEEVRLAFELHLLDRHPEIAAIPRSKRRGRR